MPKRSAGILTPNRPTKSGGPRNTEVHQGVNVLQIVFISALVTADATDWYFPCISHKAIFKGLLAYSLAHFNTLKVCSDLSYMPVVLQY